MPGPIATIDTSVLISLQCAGLLGALSARFARVLVPSKVRSELHGEGDQNKATLKALAENALFQNCDDYDPALVQLLLQNRAAAKEGCEQGEAEAVVQAAQRGASVVLVDDQLGRKWAAEHRIECHGTIWVCFELRRTGSLTELRSYYIRLLHSGRYQPREPMNAFLREFAETEIASEEYRGLIGK